MKHHLHILNFLLLFILAININAQSGIEELRKIHTKFYGKTCKAITFRQFNTHYENGQKANSVWYEAIQYPDKFRIDFGDIRQKNGILFRNDSAYLFREGKIARSDKDENTLLLILGGMYHRNFDDVTKRIINSGIDLNLFYKEKYKDKQVIVFGTSKSDSLKNQFWIDEETQLVVRMITQDADGSWLDMQVESKTEACYGFMESKVVFKRNGVLEQIEEYSNINFDPVLPENFFSPGYYGKNHWYTGNSKY